MATKGKVLKTSVRLDAKQALKTLDQLEKKMNAIQKAINKTSNGSRGLDRAVRKQSIAVNQATTSMIRNSNAAKKMAKSYSTASSTVGVLTKNLRRLASTYIGVMGIGAALRTSDVVTSAQNKLNSLEGGSPEQTSASMDKMYGAAQRARVGYADMMSNVSKSMTLAGDAFNNNIDNAIAFQEIMGKAYTLSGASAAEMSSSMYQMIQALGSGVLQGDELRSVREGASMAYKEIEKFAQEVYNTEESLKDLASQGKITSDIVVAAVMNASDAINDKFKNTAITFDQAWTMIKNSALNSFKPVLQMLNETLNSDFGKSVINGICLALQVLANILVWVFDLIGKIYNFVANNWGVISDIIMTIAVILGSVLLGALILNLLTGYKLIAQWLYMKAVAVASALTSAASWLTVCLPLTIIIALLAAVVIGIIWVADSFVDACGIIVGTLFGVWGFFKNIILLMCNVAMGLWESIKAIATNIGIAFQNCWNAAKSAFWNFIADCIDGVKGLEPVINAVAQAFGAKGFTLSGLAGNLRSKADGYTQQGYVPVGNAWSTGFNTYAYDDLTQAYSKGYDIGASAGTWVTDKLGSLTSGFSDIFEGGATSLITDDYGSMLDDIANGVGDTSGNTGKMADALDLAEEDLEYLRKLAELEWKKEYTTNTITVDMSNYNTINSDSDLDGIVTKLTDKLYEELDVFANGVYA